MLGEIHVAVERYGALAAARGLRSKLLLKYVALAAALAFSGCAQPPSPQHPAQASNSSQFNTAPQRPVGFVDLQTLPQTIGLEHQDRVNRLKRLAATQGIASPEIDELELAAGQIPGVAYPIPIVRVVFDEKVFFDFDKDTIRPEAQRILDIIAQNMKRDVPDAGLLLLGHTDAIGTDAYNVDLSRRRAQRVFGELVRRGVDPGQLEAIAVGKRQPIAPNWTEEGRARNRRVEFMISANQAANERLVEKRPTNVDYLKTTPDAPQPVAPPPVTAVLIPAPATIANPTDTDSRKIDVSPIELQEKSMIEIRPLSPEAALRTPASQPEANLASPLEYKQRELDAEFSLN